MLSCYTVWLWVIFPTFHRLILPPSSTSKFEGCSSNLLLVCPSKLTLGFGPRWDPWPYFFFVPRVDLCFEMRPPFRREERVSFLSRRYSCCTVIEHKCTHRHTASGLVNCCVYILYIALSFEKGREKWGLVLRLGR